LARWVCLTHQMANIIIITIIIIEQDDDRINL
jgi:hypothetical protein